LALSVSDASWAKFVVIANTKQDSGKLEYFSFQSDVCFVNPEVKDLKLREWFCPSCSGYNLRDENAKTYLQEGLRLLVAVIETQNACGHGVRLGATQALVDEAGITRFQSCEVQTDPQLFPGKDCLR